MSDPLWTPPENAVRDSALAAFAGRIAEECGMDWGGDYERLWSWSVENSGDFWSELWDWHGVIGTKGGVALKNPDRMAGGQFFPEGTLNYAENLLAGPGPDDSIAVIAHREDGTRREMTRLELHREAMALAGWLKSRGVRPGDRVAAYTPNIPEAIVTMLASAAVGAVFSSCSSDFGLEGATDRFGQIEPVVLMAADGYHYNGKRQERMQVVRDMAAAMPSVKSVLVVPFLDEAPDLDGLPGAVLFGDALGAADPATGFEPLPFNHPLYILYSSGTTGAPKCIIHGAGGTLLQHIKEHRLHCNISEGDRVFYFTTCGWMMWNWLVASLAARATVVLFDGNPFHPGPERLWEMAAGEGVALFGTSAKYIDAVRKSGYRPEGSVDLQRLRMVCSTGSPLTTDGFEFVYEGIRPGVHLASIIGGTDLISCFALGVPVRPVHAGEVQCRGLGMAVDVYDDDGTPLVGEQGELVCTKPFPSMPTGFWNDPDGSRYRAAYFEHFPGIWRHGDWATLTDRGTMVIHGRSDATLNPGGVRIGTSEIYRLVEAFDEIAEALVIGQAVEVDGASDVRVVLFVRMAGGQTLDDGLRDALRGAVRKGASPRHVPALILEVGDIPRTRSGKITELAVRDVVDGRPVKNTEALANPEALDYFRDRPELAT